MVGRKTTDIGGIDGTEMAKTCIEKLLWSKYCKKMQRKIDDGNVKCDVKIQVNSVGCVFQMDRLE